MKRQIMLERKRDHIFASMLEKLLNDYTFVPSLRPVNLRDMDNTENILDDQIQGNSTVTRVRGSKVVFGRSVQIREQEYIIVSQSDNYRIIHYIKHSLEIIKRYEQGVQHQQNEVIGVPKFIVDEIYALSSGSLENIKRRFNRVLFDLNSSELEADKLWPCRHELRV
jgi:hypothetical protein